MFDDAPAPGAYLTPIITPSQSLPMRHNRLTVLTALEAQGVAPVFYHPDPEVCLNIIRACARGGAPAVEFTNRGDFAADLFGEIHRELIRKIGRAHV